MTPTCRLLAPLVANWASALKGAMLALMSDVKELTLTFGTVFEPEPDDVDGVELPPAATIRAAPHAADRAPPLRWRTSNPGARIAASLSCVHADRDCCRLAVACVIRSIRSSRALWVRRAERRHSDHPPAALVRRHRARRRARPV